MNLSMLIVLAALAFPTQKAVENPAQKAEGKVLPWVALLDNEKVQKELKLTEAQIRTIKASRTDSAKALKTLTAAQQRRAQEIHYQASGGAILGDEQFARAVGLTEKERAAFHKAWLESEKKLHQFLMVARFRSAEAMREHIAKHRKDATDAMIKQLSPAQKRKYDELVGKPFDISALRK